MKNLAPITLMAISLLASDALPDDAGNASPEFAWEKTDHSLALRNRDRVVWRFNYSRDEGKPYFHPLATVDGIEITDCRPEDHPWHLGLWFSWKYINNINYWEEDRETGESEGRTKIADVQVIAEENFSARIDMRLSYHPPGRPEVLSETRTIIVTAPDANGLYTINWNSDFHASADEVVLARTPIIGETDGRPWGGYAGLSLRMNKRMKKLAVRDSRGNMLTGNPGKQEAESKPPMKWAVCSNEDIDGKGVFVGIANRSKDFTETGAWYVIPGMPFISPACLYKGSQTLTGGQKIELSYKVIVARDPVTAISELRDGR